MLTRSNQFSSPHPFRVAAPAQPQEAFVWHLTSVKNLKSILENGLLSHTRVREFNLLKQDVSAHDVQLRRSRISAFDVPLHQFVPTFWVQRNPMMYRLRHRANDLVWLQIAREKVNEASCVTATQNAASNGVQFKLGQCQALLDWNILNAPVWNQFTNGGPIRGAELLVRDHIPVDAIVGMQVCSKATWNEVSYLVAHFRRFIPVHQAPYSFFW